MSESLQSGGEGSAPSPSQSGIQIWFACALFILVPVLLILLLKHFLHFLDL